MIVGDTLRHVSLNHDFMKIMFVVNVKKKKANFWIKMCGWGTSQPYLTEGFEKAFEGLENHETKKIKNEVKLTFTNNKLRH